MYLMSCPPMTVLAWSRRIQTCTPLRTSLCSFTERHEYMPVSQRGLGKRKPFCGRSACGLGDDFDDVAVLERRVEVYELMIYFCTGDMVADIGVDGVGKVNRTRADGEVYHIAFGGKDKDAMAEKILPKVGDEAVVVCGALMHIGDFLYPCGHALFVFLLRPADRYGRFVVLRLGTPPKRIEQGRNETGHPCAGLDIRGFVAALRLLVDEGRGDTKLRLFVHLFRADLQFENGAVMRNDCRVERLIAVRLWKCDKVLDALGKRPPELMYDAKRAVAFFNRRHNNANSEQVVDGVDVPVAASELVEETVHAFH